MVPANGIASEKDGTIAVSLLLQTVSVGRQMPIKHVPIYAGREPTVFDSF
jgi:hypothetical protein